MPVKSADKKSSEDPIAYFKNYNPVNKLIMKSLKISKQIYYLMIFIPLVFSCKKEEVGNYDFVDKQPTGIFKMDISAAQISEQYGDKNWEILTETELHENFVRLKGINFRKLDDKTLLIDNYDFSKKVTLEKLDNGYSFGLIYEIPGDEENYVSPVMISFYGTITGDKIAASYSVLTYFYTYGQEWHFQASYVFETTLSWINENQWEPAGPKITDISDLGLDVGIRLFFEPNIEDFVPIKEFRIYRINDITSQIEYIMIGTMEVTQQSSFYFHDATEWALNASNMSTPGYLVSAVGKNGIESFLTQESFKAIVIKR
jgi:hypothetical protein